MPIKFQKSQTVRNRATGNLETTHYYIKNMSKGALIEKDNSGNLKPKVKQKVKNELVRRGGVTFGNA